MLFLGAAPAKHVIVNPSWDVRPDADVMEAAYPAGALERGIEGHVTVQCKVSVDETLTDCTVVEETPAGEGFGEAVLTKVAPLVRMHPQTVDGKPVGGAEVRVPFSFKQDMIAFGGADALEYAEGCMGAIQAHPVTDEASYQAYGIWYLMFNSFATARGLKPSEIGKRLEAARLAGEAAADTDGGKARLSNCRRYAAEAMVQRKAKP